MCGHYPYPGQRHRRRPQTLLGGTTTTVAVNGIRDNAHRGKGDAREGHGSEKRLLVVLLRQRTEGPCEGQSSMKRSRLR